MEASAERWRAYVARGAGARPKVMANLMDVTVLKKGGDRNLEKGLSTLALN